MRKIRIFTLSRKKFREIKIDLIFKWCCKIANSLAKFFRWEGIFFHFSTMCYVNDWTTCKTSSIKSRHFFPLKRRSSQQCILEVKNPCLFLCKNVQKLLISAMAELAKNLAFLAEAPLHFCTSSKINNSYFVNYFTRFAVTKIRNKHFFFISYLGMFFIYL